MRNRRLRDSLRKTSLLEALEPRRLLTVTMVADLNTATQPSVPSQFAQVNGKLIFRATDGLTGYELYRSDGTTQGTIRLSDFNPGSENGMPNDGSFLPNTVNANGLLFFPATTPNGEVIAVTDGTPQGTHVLKDIISDPLQGLPNKFVALNGFVYFTAYSSGASSLWRTDGTLQNTTQVAQQVSKLHDLTAVGNQLYFIANGGELWKSDGTTLGTMVVATIPKQSPVIQSEPGDLTNLNGKLFFLAHPPGGETMYESDGTAGGTVPLFDTGNYAYGFDDGPLAFNGKLYFAHYDPETATELYSFDPTVDTAPILVKDINPGTGYGQPEQMTVVNGLIYFTANDGVNGTQLWRTDGTTGGTVRLSNVASGTVRYITPFQGVAYFRAAEIGEGSTTGLYRTNGTPEGTSRVGTLNISYSSTGQPLAVGNQLFLPEADPAHGTELWHTDGTEHGNELVKDINLLGDTNGPGEIYTVGDTVFFAEGTPDVGNELWKMPVGGGIPTLVKDINPGPGGSNPGNLTAIGNILYFQASDNLTGAELWRSDGTAAGTYRVKDIYPGVGYNADRLEYRSSAPARFIALDSGKFLFTANDGIHGNEPWISDGTEAGTQLLIDLNPQNDPVDAGGIIAPPASSITAGPIRFGGKLYFVAQGSLWQTDGTTQGTTPFFSNAQGPLAVSGNTLFFEGGDLQLWKSDGAAGGTVPLKKIAAQAGVTINGIYYFPASNGLWKSDGTPEGTVQVKSFSYGPYSLTSFKDNLYFAASDGTTGLELWISDGTANGTTLLRDIAANTGSDTVNSSSPTYFTSVGNLLYFVANDKVHGLELWQTDGTTAGTKIAVELISGITGSSPSSLTAAGNTLFFSANDGIHGREVWRIDLISALSSTFDPDTHSLVLTFIDNVSASLNLASVAITNVATHASVSPVSFHYDAATNEAVYVLPGSLPDGNYHATLSAAGITSPAGASLATDINMDFFSLVADANHDRSIDFADLVVVAQNYSGAGKTLSQGDFNNDGMVDFNDLVLIAQRYGQTLPPPNPVATSPAAAPALSQLIKSIRPSPKLLPFSNKPIIPAKPPPKRVQTNGKGILVKR